jgi:hypothetical protein
MMKYSKFRSPVVPCEGGWKLEVQLVFAPPTAKEYKEMMQNDYEDVSRLVV